MPGADNLIVEARAALLDAISQPSKPTRHR